MPIAQSGIPSAVGLCIEEAWGTVPITVSSGYANVIGKTTCPHRFCIVNPGGSNAPTADRVKPHDEIDGSFSLKRNFITGKQYPFSFEVKADPEVLYYPCLGIFGRDIQTLVETGVYDHVFRQGNYRPSFSLETILGDGTYGQVTSGCLFERLEIDLAATVGARFSGYGKHHTPNAYFESGALTAYDFGSAQNVIPTAMGGNTFKTFARTAAPTYVDVASAALGDGPLVFASMAYGRIGGLFASAFVTVDGVAKDIDLLEGSNITLEKNLDRRLTGGSGYDMGACIGNQFVVTGRLNLLFRDNTFEQAMLKDLKIGLNLKLVGASIGASSFYEFEIYVPQFRLDAGAPSIPGGALLLDLPFTAQQDAVLGYDVQFRLRNTFDNSTLAGTYASTPGGLGGWQNA